MRILLETNAYPAMKRGPPELVGTISRPSEVLPQEMRK